MLVEAFSYLMVVGFEKNVITFGANMGSSVHTHNRKKYILIFAKGPT